MEQISDLNDLRLFAEVVDRGSYTAAARHLSTKGSSWQNILSFLC